MMKTQCLVALTLLLQTSMANVITTPANPDDLLICSEGGDSTGLSFDCTLGDDNAGHMRQWESSACEWLLVVKRHGTTERLQIEGPSQVGSLYATRIRKTKDAILCSLYIKKGQLLQNDTELQVTVRWFNPLEGLLTKTFESEIEMPRPPRFRLVTGEKVEKELVIVPGNELDLICYVYHGKPKVYSVTMECGFPIARTGETFETWRGVSLVLNTTGTIDMDGKMCDCYGNHVTGKTVTTSIVFRVATPTTTTSSTSTTTKSTTSTSMTTTNSPKTSTMTVFNTSLITTTSTDYIVQNSSSSSSSSSTFPSSSSFNTTTSSSTNSTITPTFRGKVNDMIVNSQGLHSDYNDNKKKGNDDDKNTGVTINQSHNIIYLWVTIIVCGFCGAFT